MKSYFLNITEDEKKSISSKHRELYNGYQTLQPKNGMTQLNVENLAQDDKGITVNNKNEVTEYKNKGINKPMMSQCNECGNMVNEGETCECGTSRYSMEEDENYDFDKSLKYTEEQIEENIKIKSKKDKVFNQINESLDWFKRFKKY